MKVEKYQMHKLEFLRYLILNAQLVKCFNVHIAYKVYFKTGVETRAFLLHQSKHLLKEWRLYCSF